MSIRYTIFFGIGSNMANRNEHLNAAAVGLSDLVDDIRESRRYESLPRYNVDQPAFLNSVLVGVTDANLYAILDRIQRIEEEEGRDRRSAGWKGPRPLDIDILLAGDQIVDSERLMIPHQGIYERKFVLFPLLELVPECVDPVSGVRFSEFFTKLDDQGIYYSSLDEFTTK